MLYDFIHSLASEFSVEMLCAVLEVSRTAYYRYQRGASYQLSAAKEENKQLVEKVFGEHKRRYGNPGPPVRSDCGRVTGTRA